eukprot:CAMPEP_0173138452 /NCGR_PEP_ID=MMETSP1105-20130129/3699_1 /TAXON_ID=2985 /ORGANISM="Ochromonas sp., Strain BG-1" /LENGTH=858 /DNA_ID=CAMNT_0014051051 /DNA_START=306 /DNA_END=2882 /DNA_ORIENTATION=-
MIVWDSLTYMPVKTFPLPHTFGVKALDISEDGLYIATLSDVPAEYDQDQYFSQELAIWAWTTEEELSIQRCNIQSNIQRFKHVKFNPTNPFQLSTTSQDAVQFWDWNNFRLESYFGKISKLDLGNFSGEFTSSIFLPNTETALTATSHGYIVVWENRNITIKTKVNVIKSAVKVVKLLECGINLMDTTSNQYLVLGCQDGAIRFYDYFLRLEAWFEELNAGPVHSLSFSLHESPFSVDEGGKPGLKFWAPDFIVSTKNAFVIGVESSLFEEIRKEDRRGTLLMQGLSDSVTALACHPLLPLVAFLCKTSVLQLWNYEMKLLMNLREFSFQSNQSVGHNDTNAVVKAVTARDVSFHPQGKLLALAFSSGMIKFLTTDTLQDVQSFNNTSDPLVKIKFSISGKYLAAFDESQHVMLYQRDDEKVISPPGHSSQENRLDGAYVYVGRAVAHTGKIIGIQFGMRENFIETLISVSEDRYCVEYDLLNSSISNGLQPIKMTSPEGLHYSSVRIEMTAKPTCVLWHPRREEDVEDRFLTVNSEFKIKQYNIDSKQCRKTTLAPRYGFPPNELLIVPYSTINQSDQTGQQLWQSTFIFSTHHRIIGVGHFPLDGNPEKTMGIVAHPGEITSIAVSFDGKFVFSAGGSDLTVNMWNLFEEYPDLTDQSNNSILPYLQLLEGGPYGELHQNLIDYFYYCQLRHGGEDTLDTRFLSGKIPLEEIPALMRSVGFYPSEEEVLNMINEIRYKYFMVTGETQDFIEMDELIRLYTNHRPVIPLEKHLISQAFTTINQRINPHVNHSSIAFGKIKEVLTKEGEKIDSSDLETYLSALVGEPSQNGETLIDNSSYINSKVFATKVLGFDDDYT